MNSISALCSLRLHLIYCDMRYSPFARCFPLIGFVLLIGACKAPSVQRMYSCVFLSVLMPPSIRYVCGSIDPLANLAPSFEMHFGTYGKEADPNVTSALKGLVQDDGFRLSGIPSGFLMECLPANLPNYSCRMRPMEGGTWTMNFPVECTPSVITNAQGFLIADKTQCDIVASREK